MKSYIYDIEEINKSLPLDFDVNIYKELNPDLNEINDINAKFHYINNGSKEGRLYKNITI
jgi:hypothetical protein